MQMLGHNSPWCNCYNIRIIRCSLPHIRHPEITKRYIQMLLHFQFNMPVLNKFTWALTSGPGKE